MAYDNFVRPNVLFLAILETANTIAIKSGSSFMLLCD